MIHPKGRAFRKVNRHSLRRTYERKSCRLRFGLWGLQATEEGFLSAAQIEAIRRTLTSRLKRKGKVWIRAYPDYPRTAKPKEVRRGRGKGAVSEWVAVLKPGRVLFELAGRDQFLLRSALTFTIRKMPVRVRLIGRRPMLEERSTTLSTDNTENGVHCPYGWLTKGSRMFVSIKIVHDCKRGVKSSWETP